MENNISTLNSTIWTNPKSADNLQKKNPPVTENLDKDAFLKLLVTELRHQDPTQPMENKEFISQMAQFSALEQMTNVNKSIQILNKSSRSGEAYSLLGKNIQAFDPVTGRKVDGTVTGIFYKGDDIRLIVDGKDIGLNDIHAVYTNYQSNSDDSQNSNIGTIKENIPSHKVEGGDVISQPKAGKYTPFFEQIQENNIKDINTSKDIVNNNDTNNAQN